MRVEGSISCDVDGCGDHVFDSFHRIPPASFCDGDQVVYSGVMGFKGDLHKV